MPNGDGKMTTIGVLALQGAVAEHMEHLNRLGNVRGVLVKTEAQLQAVDGMSRRGGESTTMGKLLHEYGMMQLLRDSIMADMPVWGTCAGMILLSKHIVKQDWSYLDVLDASVRRNAYGSQLHSFQTTRVIEKVSGTRIPLVFIRAPYIEQVGPQAEILLELDGHVVAVEQQHILATSFHPELTSDLTMHRYFADKIVHVLQQAS